jgi:hypothetical protein
VVLLAGALVAGYLIARTLQLHAGFLGRRWAKRVAGRITGQVRQRIADDLLVPLEEFEASRAALHDAVRSAEECS